MLSIPLKNSSKTRDIYHWDQALFGGKLITERSVAAMITPRNPSSLVGQDYYGYGTIIDTVFNDKVRTGHGGQINGYSCYYSRIIGEDLTIITLTNKWTKADWISGMNKDLAAIVLGESYDIPALRVFTQLEDPVVQKIVGEYAFSPDFSLVISKNADQLYAQASGQHKMKLFATSGNSLYIEEIDAEISLVKDEDGKIIGLQFYQNGQAHQAKKVK